MRNRRRQLYMAHPLTPYLCRRDLDAAAVADHPAEPHALEFPAMAFPIYGRPEYALAKQPFQLGLQSAVIYRSGRLHLAVRPGKNLLRRGNADF